MGRERQHLGRHGEALARRAYERAGYTVLAQNWRCADGEIDLVLGRDECVVVCEVKTRATTFYGLPAEAVGWAKQRRLRALAARWLAEHGVHAPLVRFDVASVVGGRVTIIEAAF